jgi:hypothetical protein
VKVTVFPAIAYVPCVLLTVFTMKIEGSGSTTTTFVAVMPPGLVTIIVKVTISPGSNKPELANLLICGSVTITTGVGLGATTVTPPTVAVAVAVLVASTVLVTGLVVVAVNVAPTVLVAVAVFVAVVVGELQQVGV